MSEISLHTYKPEDYESERASNSYLMSLVALIVGLPLPIINLMATLFFYLQQRKSTYFVRWHCTQALISQASVVLVNSIGMTWTLSIIFGPSTISNPYIAYLIVVFCYNILEIATTIYTAIEVRKGKHIEWWFVGPFTNLICKR
jgi:hypothetical protein